MKTYRLASRENYRKVEEEWQLQFIYYVLEKIGIPEEILNECFPVEEEELTVVHRINLRKHMDRFNVSIIDDLDGGIKIYVEQQLIAEWKKCKFTMKEDLQEVNPSRKLYVEICGDIWTVFDEEESL